MIKYLGLEKAVGKQKSKMTEGDGRRRSTRLQSLSTSYPTLPPCTKVSSTIAFRPCSKFPNLKPHTSSVSVKRIKQVEKGNKLIQDLPPPNQNQESEGQSSSHLEPELDTMLINHTAPSPSRPLEDTVDAMCDNVVDNGNDELNDTVDAMCDNVVDNGNEEIREADSSPGAASAVGAPPVQQRRPNANPTVSNGLTEIGNMLGDEDSSEDEVESSALITIMGKYSVKEALAPTVRKIIEKHGDIAANYVMETPQFRSLALEQLAIFIQKYQENKFTELSETKIESALEIVSDFSKGGLEMRWLEQRLKELLEARKTVKDPKFKEKKNEINQVIKEKTAFLKIVEPQVITAKQELSKALAEDQVIKESVAKVKYFYYNSPFAGLI